ncbi:MAG: alanine--tRNA ligase [Holosporales bacterium]|nr:alanine--tRNA ligase [Holosporales bacterium]
MHGLFITLNDIRKKFLDYFAKNDHVVVPSSILVPENDPTLLFTNAGMNQFKDYFTGKISAPFKRATTAQKCVRAGGKHNDLENVGYTARHHTFFEMLGNFSFADYFKEQAIYYAWQFVTKELELPQERLYVTVYSEDDEASTYWKKITGFSDSKIIRIATTDNFWSMGDVGPCGPCTEIFYDHGENIVGGPPGSATADGDRFTEIWNLVFMQYEQKSDGTRINLPLQCIDTGMGLERIAAILQGKQSNFEVDVFVDLIKEIRRITRKTVGEDKSCNVIADHMRAICFLIADGVSPLNEGRGYVLRRIIRRAIRHARILGATEPVLYILVDKMTELMGDQYKELDQCNALIKNVLLDEEKRFGETLDNGLKLVDESIRNLSSNTLPGSVAFKLYDTYGFPVDLTADILKSNGLSVDFDEFNTLMQRQQSLSKRSNKFSIKSTECDIDLGEVPETIQCCYNSYFEYSCVVVHIHRFDDKRFGIVLDQTPFFPESGGQIGDSGHIANNNTEFLVNKTYMINKRIVHEGTFHNGIFLVGDKVQAECDLERRMRISAHHSAAHILQAALRSKLGNYVKQKGSLIEDTKFRFDFTWNGALSKSVKEDIEHYINSVIYSALPCETIVCARSDVHDALAFFDNKYETNVRVVKIGKETLVGNHNKSKYISKELCCGTHVTNTGNIGTFKILSECGVAAGVRRIEAVCGRALSLWIDQMQEQSKNEIDQLKNECKLLRTQLQESSSANQVGDMATEIIENVEITFCRMYNSTLVQQIRQQTVDLQKRIVNGAVVVVGLVNDNAVVVVGVSDSSVGDINANNLVQLICKEHGWRGGGSARIAQCGGRCGFDFDQLLEQIKPSVRRFFHKDKSGPTHDILKKADFAL